MLSCFVDNYSPAETYSHSGIQKIVNSIKNVLCFYAKETRQQRCVMAIDFDRYDQSDGSVPLHILSDKEIWALSLTQGEALQNAYNESEIGKDIIVIYTDRNCKGWFNMKFELGKYTNTIS